MSSHKYNKQEAFTTAVEDYMRHTSKILDIVRLSQCTVNTLLPTPPWVVPVVSIIKQELKSLSHPSIWLNKPSRSVRNLHKSLEASLYGGSSISNATFWETSLHLLVPHTCSLGLVIIILW